MHDPHDCTPGIWPRSYGDVPRKWPNIEILWQESEPNVLMIWENDQNVAMKMAQT
jgi:hypothetical protein